MPLFHNDEVETKGHACRCSLYNLVNPLSSQYASHIVLPIQIDSAVCTSIHDRTKRLAEGSLVSNASQNARHRRGFQDFASGFEKLEMADLTVGA